MFPKKTIRDIGWVDGQRVLVRADLNVPMNGDQITDDFRLLRALDTIQYLIRRNCSVVVCAHLGRPNGSPNPAFSLRPVAERLGILLGFEVLFTPECIGPVAANAANALEPGQVLLLENLRFHPEEEANDPAFAQALAAASGASYFVQDGFGVVHRAHASTDAITRYLPSIAGLLLESEIVTITNAMQSPQRPLTAILGGAKISDKITVIERLIDVADQIIIGGAMANTFLAYRGLAMGRSLVEPGQEPVLQRIYQRAEQKVGAQAVDTFLALPSDAVVALSPQAPSVTTVSVQAIPADQAVFDIGPSSAAYFAQLVQSAATVIWNGPLGMTENQQFSHGSEAIAQTLAAQSQTHSLIGGGDTADFIRSWSQSHNQYFGYISTGGGASLELMAGNKLPGVEALQDI